jgi:hypothetical protein
MAHISLPESLLFDLVDEAAYDSDPTASFDSHLDELSNQLRPAIDKTLNALCDLNDESRTLAIARFMRSMSRQQKSVDPIQALMHESLGAQTHPVCRKAYINFLANAAG